MPQRFSEDTSATSSRLLGEETDNEMGEKWGSYHRNSTQGKRSWLLVPLVSIMSVLLFLNLVVMIFRPTAQFISGFGSYERGFNTELDIAKESIGLEQKTFTGGIRFNSTGGSYIEDIPGPKYVGPPSPEMDEAWADLLEGMIINVPLEEGRDVADRTYLNPEFGFYETGLDVYHQLHCVNRIRKLLEPQYYGTHLDLSAHGSDIHKWHCLDYLRQVLMCTGDMTPIVTKYEPNVDISVPRFEQTHTCRNWGQLDRWAKKKLAERPRGYALRHPGGGHH